MLGDLIEAAINFLILPAAAVGILVGGLAAALFCYLHVGELSWVYVSADAVAGGILNSLLFHALGRSSHANPVESLEPGIVLL